MENSIKKILRNSKVDRLALLPGRVGVATAASRHDVAAAGSQLDVQLPTQPRLHSRDRRRRRLRRPRFALDYRPDIHHPTTLCTLSTSLGSDASVTDIGIFAPAHTAHIQHRPASHRIVTGSASLHRVGIQKASASRIRSCSRIGNTRASGSLPPHALSSHPPPSSAHGDTASSRLCPLLPTRSLPGSCGRLYGRAAVTES